MQRSGWNSMFGRNTESSSSSERTKKLKTKHIFRNRGTLTESGTLFYDSNNLQRDNSNGRLFQCRNRIICIK